MHYAVSKRSQEASLREVKRRKKRCGFGRHLRTVQGDGGETLARSRQRQHRSPQDHILQVHPTVRTNDHLLGRFGKAR
eukprot:2063797-Pyramimonas_sp.AAC.1